MTSFPKFVPAKSSAEKAMPANAANLANALPRRQNISRISQTSHAAPPIGKTEPSRAVKIMDIPLRPCIWCKRYSFSSRQCEHYDRQLPEPTRECRCVHFEKRR